MWENTMRITRRRLIQIIKEEKEKLELAKEINKEEDLDEGDKEDLDEMEDWGEGSHEYKRQRGPGGVEHRAGDVGGHYKDYMGPYGGDKGDVSKTHPRRRDYMGETRKRRGRKIKVSKNQLRRIVKEALRLRKK